MIHIFVVNHFAGNNMLSRNIRKYLATKDNLRYFVFNTVHAGFEAEISRKVKRYFENEKLRFYCCGGSGTMRNMLNGFDEEDLAKIEVAFFPCGLTNDFLKNFDNEEAFKELDNLINGKVEKVDYIKTNHGIALNTLSVGYDSNVEKAMQHFRVYDAFHPMIPYILSVAKGIIFAKPREIEIKIDGVPNTEKYVEIVYGNGAVLGGNLFFTEHSSIVDGTASYLTVSGIDSFEAIAILTKIMGRKLKSTGKKVKYGSCKTIAIRSLDGKPIAINFDGELVDCGRWISAEIVEKGLNFVVPRNTEIKDYIL